MVSAAMMSSRINIRCLEVKEREIERRKWTGIFEREAIVEALAAGVPDAELRVCLENDPAAQDVRAVAAT